MTTRAKMKHALAEAVRVARGEGGDKQPSGAHASTFQGRIVKELGRAASDLLANVKPDTGRGANLSSVLAEMYMWAQIRKMADGNYERLMDIARSNGVIDVDNGLEA